MSETPSAAVLNRAPLPDAFDELRAWELASPAQLAQLRADLHDELGLARDVELGSIPARLVLVASELATNALRHGLPPTVVRLLRDGEQFALDVADHDLGREPVIPEGRELGEGGYGLLLTTLVSLDAGWYREGETKNIWATFAA